MIEILNGMHETIQYECSLGLRLHHNIYFEDYPEHWHLGVEIIMPVKGGYEVVVGSQHYKLEMDDVLLINSGVIHALKAPTTGERFIFQFDANILYHLKEMETLLFMMPPVVVVRKRDGGVLHGFMREKLEKIITEYQGKSTLKEASIYAALIEIFVELGRHEVYRNPAGRQIETTKQQEYLETVINACSYINQHYMEHISLEEVAFIGGFSKYHFTRIFKQYMNMTFYEYLNSKRVKRAEELLYNTKEFSITDVAMYSGFHSMSAFNRTFKLLKNCSPSDYRKIKQQKCEADNI